MTDLKMLRALIDAQSEIDALRGGIWTLGQLRDALAALPGDTPVTCDTGGAPATLQSYRGYYERLSIGTKRYRDDYETVLNAGGPGFDSAILGHYQPGANDVDIAEPVTAAELIKALDLADGVEFEGYKGGQFLMTGGTYLHVADNGDCGPAVVGIDVNEGRGVVIVTSEDDS